jgi:1-acyl-sn-glycerol-3-phosphate acyltransferase
MESRSSLRRVIAYLREGEGVVIFPEATYYRDKMGPGQKGLIRMVLSQSKAPFVPVGIRYSGKRGRKLVEISYGRPVRGDPPLRAEEFLDQMLKEIARLSGLR